MSLHRGAMGWSVIVVFPGCNYLPFGRGGSKISGKGVHIMYEYKGVGVRFADFISFLLNIP